MSEVIITKLQCEAMLEYMEMYGVTALKMDKDTIEDSLSNFSPSEGSFHKEQKGLFRCCGSLPHDPWVHWKERENAPLAEKDGKK